MSFRRVLVAVDLLDDSCEAVIERALDMVPSSQVISLLSVVNDLLPGAPDGSRSTGEQQQQMHSLTQDVLTQLCERYGIPNFLVERGHPAAAIHRVAEWMKADLVIIGCHSRHGWRALLGSTANAVLHGTKSNVCAVHTENCVDQQPSHHYRRILAAVNESDDTKEVVNEAVRLANLQRARLSLVCVVRSQAIWSTGLGNEGLERTQADLLDQCYEYASSSMRAIAQAHGLAQEDCYLRVGDPVHEINQLAADLDSQLVVLGTHGVPGLRVISGSTANELIRTQSRDTLAVRLKPPRTGLLARPAKLVRTVTSEGLRDREHLSMS